MLREMRKIESPHLEGLSIKKIDRMNIKFIEGKGHWGKDNKSDGKSSRQVIEKRMMRVLKRRSDSIRDEIARMLSGET